MIAALDVTTGLSLLSLIVFVVLAVAAAAWAVFKAADTAQTIALLQTNVNAQQQRAVEAERENAMLRVDLAALKTRVKNAEDMASGTKAVGELKEMLSRQHRELLDAIGAPRTVS